MNKYSPVYFSFKTFAFVKSKITLRVSKCTLFESDTIPTKAID